MSMSTHLIAFRDMDGEFAKMLKIKLFCEENGVSYPPEVEAYFGAWAHESEDEVRAHFLQVDLGRAARRYEEEDREGFEIDVAKIPQEVKTIRFYNSY